jgi:Fur family ferric uptake transcriptional regulator
MQKSTSLPCGRKPPREAPTRKTTLAQWQEMLRVYVEAHQLKNSESRNKILTVIASDQSHFNPQVLVKRVMERYPDVGAATVYRNIPILLAAGVIQESLTEESGEPLYELSDETHHDHIVCVDCGAIFEFHEDLIEKTQEKVIAGLRFKSVRHKHVIYAQCDYRSREGRVSRARDGRD